MSTQTVVLDLPESLYQRLKARAEQTQRTVAAEVLDVVATAVSEEESLPDDFTAAISPLAGFDDADLWRAAQLTMSPEAREQLEDLHFKQQREGLTEVESQLEITLVRQYERTILVRAQAAALLKERGHDLSSLLTIP